MNIRHLLTIYRELQYNDISVIEENKHFQINTFNCINSKLRTILLYILFKTQQKATGLTKYEHKTFVDYL
jgi:hypothetical protein